MSKFKIGDKVRFEGEITGIVCDFVANIRPIGQTSKWPTETLQLSVLTLIPDPVPASEPLQRDADGYTNEDSPRYGQETPLLFDRVSIEKKVREGDSNSGYISVFNVASPGGNLYQVTILPYRETPDRQWTPQEQFEIYNSVKAERDRYKKELDEIKTNPIQPPEPSMPAQETRSELYPFHICTLQPIAPNEPLGAPNNFIIQGSISIEDLAKELRKVEWSRIDDVPVLSGDDLIECNDCGLKLRRRLYVQHQVSYHHNRENNQPSPYSGKDKYNFLNRGEKE